MPDGSDRWTILAGTVATGEAITLHESWVPAGTPSLPLHTIAHSQLIFVLEGTLEYLHDGVSDRAEAGSVIYVPFGTTDLVKNIGAGVARYFVMHIGGDTRKA
jgi:quercetin dioxygenase-like cupin family protein